MNGVIVYPGNFLFHSKTLHFTLKNFSRALYLCFGKPASPVTLRGQVEEGQVLWVYTLQWTVQDTLKSSEVLF